MFCAESLTFLKFLPPLLLHRDHKIRMCYRQWSFACCCFTERQVGGSDVEL